jgi:hypothetical protein
MTGSERLQERDERMKYYMSNQASAKNHEQNISSRIMKSLQTEDLIHIFLNEAVLQYISKSVICK